MKASFDFRVEKDSFNKWNTRVESTISHIGNYSRKALVEACEEIISESLYQVPYDTGTLYSSAGYEITGNYKTGWSATLGYGNVLNYVNPVTGRMASEYAGIVHEDLDALHILGKAKFLEDPVRQYAQKYPRTVFKYVQESILGGSR